MMLKLYIYGYLNRVPSSRRLERECQRNIEMIWLTEQLAPDFKTIADFPKDNGKAIRKMCREFVALCHKLGLLSAASVAIDGSKFKAVNARDKNFGQDETASGADRGEHRAELPERVYWTPDNSAQHSRMVAIFQSV
jgi:transposase